MLCSCLHDRFHWSELHAHEDREIYGIFNGIFITFLCSMYKLGTGEVIHLAVIYQVQNPQAQEGLVSCLESHIKNYGLMLCLKTTTKHLTL